MPALRSSKRALTSSMASENPTFCDPSMMARAQALSAELSPAERGRLVRRPTDDIEAYQLCVRGRLALMQYTADQMRLGIEETVKFPLPKGLKL